MPDTSSNGHMLSLLNKVGEREIRFSKEALEKYFEELGTSTFESYGATMRRYVLFPDEICSDIDLLVKYLNKGFDFVMTLEPR